MVNNPIVINIHRTLYIHGADKVSVLLRSCNPLQPMFKIERADLVQIASVRLEPTYEMGQRELALQNPSYDWPLIVVEPIAGPGATASPLEIVDARIHRGSVRIRSAGSHRIQNVEFTTGGFPLNAIELDHDGSDLLVVGGNFTSGRFCKSTDTPPIPRLGSCFADDPCVDPDVCLHRSFRQREAKPDHQDERNANARDAPTSQGKNDAGQTAQHPNQPGIAELSDDRGDEPSGQPRYDQDDPPP